MKALSKIDLFKRLSDILGVAKSAFEDNGVFNGFLNVDSALGIDIMLLEKSAEEEFQNGYSRVGKYFEDLAKVISIIPDGDTKGIAYKRAHKLLQFPELRSLSLGHGSDSNSGRGIGPKHARDILNNALQIYQSGVNDPDIFLLIPIFTENIGVDLISDMIARIILPDLYAYSERMSRVLELPSKKFTFKGCKYLIATVDKNAKEPILLLPQDVLTTLPVVLDWSDMDKVHAENAQARDQLGELVGEKWKRVVIDNQKADTLNLLCNNGTLLKSLITDVKERDAVSYDFKTDPDGFQIWDKLISKFANKHELDQSIRIAATNEKFQEYVAGFLNHFKTLIERNGLEKHLYKDDKKARRRESFLQLLFFGLALTYCERDGIKVTPESDSGRGPVDFVFSVGSKRVSIVETKFADNPKLDHGWEHQLRTYEKAEKSSSSFYVIVRTTDHENKKLKALKKEYAHLKKSGEDCPTLLVIDGVRKLSASVGFFDFQ